MRDRRMWRHALACVPASLAQHRRAPHDPGHQVDLGALGYRLVHGAGYVLALARAVAVHERRQDRHAQLLADDVIGMPHLWCDRGQIVLAIRRRVVATVHHHADERQMNKVAALVVAPRPLVAERRDASMNQRRVPPGESVIAKTNRLEPTLWRRFKQDVGRSQKRLELLAIRLPIKIEHERTFAAIVLPEEQRTFGVWPVLVERPDAACRITTRRFDLEHISAKSREREPAIFGLFVRDLDDPDARQRSGLRRGPRCARWDGIGRFEW